MRMRCALPALAAAWMLAAAPPPPAIVSEQAAAPAGRSDAPALEVVLERLDRVADLYRDNALKFSCHETIVLRRGRPDPHVHELDYIYVYDETEGLVDYRTERARSRKQRQGGAARRVRLSELDLPVLIERPYSWIFVFERAKRGMYRYALLRDEKALGRRALVVGFDAVPPFEKDFNEWFGAAWVDRETFQLLRVEALDWVQQEERRRLDADLAAAPEEPDGRDYAVTRVATEFGVEKNGMRFPSVATIERARFEVSSSGRRRRAAEHALFRIEHLYRDYRFFGVRTNDEIWRLVSGGGAPRAPGEPSPRPE